MVRKSSSGPHLISNFEFWPNRYINPGPVCFVTFDHYTLMGALFLTHACTNVHIPLYIAQISQTRKRCPDTINAVQFLTLTYLDPAAIYSHAAKAAKPCIYQHE